MVIASLSRDSTSNSKRNRELRHQHVFIHKFDPVIHTGVSLRERCGNPSATKTLWPSGAVPVVKYVAPFLGLTTSSKSAIRTGTLRPQVQGTLPEYERMSSVHIAEGRFFTDAENQHRSTLCLGADIADKFSRGWLRLTNRYS